MTSNNMASLNALSDQAWKAAAQHLDDIIRISLCGSPYDDRDTEIIRATLNVCAGEIIRRQSEIEEIESSDDA